MSRTKKICNELLKPSLDPTIKTLRNGSFILEYNFKLDADDNPIKQHLLGKGEFSTNYRDFTLHVSHYENRDITDMKKYFSFYKEVSKKNDVVVKIEGNNIIAKKNGKKSKYKLKEIKDIYEFLQDNMLKDSDEIQKITKKFGLTLNFSSNKKNLVNRALLIYFRKNIINKYSRRRRGENIAISDFDFIKMCLVPSFKPNIVYQVRTKFSDFYKINLELLGFAVLNNRYTPNEMKLLSILDYGIDELLKLTEIKIENRKLEINNNFKSFIENFPEESFNNLKSKFDMEIKKMEKPTLSQIFRLNRGKKYQKINFFYVLEYLSFQQLNEIREKITFFKKINKHLKPEYKKILTEYIKKLDEVNSKYELLRKTNSLNNKKNLLIHQYILEQLKRNQISTMIKNESIVGYNKNNVINLKLNDVSFKTDDLNLRNFKRFLNGVLDNHDISELNFKWTLKNKERDTDILPILKNSKFNEPYYSYKLKFKVPKSNFKKSIDLSEYEFKLNFIMDDGDLNVPTLQGRKKLINGKYTAVEKNYEFSGSKIISLHIKFLFEKYVIELLNDSKNKMLSNKIIKMIDNGNVTINDSSILNFHTGYLNQFEKQRPNRKTHNNGSSKNTPEKFSESSTGSVPKQESRNFWRLELEYIESSFKKILNENEKIKEIMSSDDLNHYQKIYLLILLYNTIRVLNNTKEFDNKILTFDKKNISINIIFKHLKGKYVDEDKSIKNFISGFYNKRIKIRLKDKHNKNELLIKKGDSDNFRRMITEELYKYKIPFCSKDNILNQIYSENNWIKLDDISDGKVVFYDPPPLTNLLVILEHLQFNKKKIKLDIGGEDQNNLLDIIVEKLFIPKDDEDEDEDEDINKIIREENVREQFNYLISEDNKCKPENNNQKGGEENEVNFIRLKRDISKSDNLYKKNYRTISTYLKLIKNFSSKVNVQTLIQSRDKVIESKDDIIRIIEEIKLLFNGINDNILNYNISEKFKKLIDKPKYISNLSNDLYKSYSYYPDVLIPIIKSFKNIYNLHIYHNYSNKQEVTNLLIKLGYIVDGKMNIYKILYDNKKLYEKLRRKYNIDTTYAYASFLRNKLNIPFGDKNTVVKFIQDSIDTNDYFIKYLPLFIQDYLENHISLEYFCSQTQKFIQFFEKLKKNLVFEFIIIIEKILHEKGKKIDIEEKKGEVINTTFIKLLEEYHREILEDILKNRNTKNIINSTKKFYKRKIEERLTAILIQIGNIDEIEKLIDDTNKNMDELKKKELVFEDNFKKFIELKTKLNLDDIKASIKKLNKATKTGVLEYSSGKKILKKSKIQKVVNEKIIEIDTIIRNQDQINELNTFENNLKIRLNKIKSEIKIIKENIKQLNPEITKQEAFEKILTKIKQLDPKLKEFERKLKKREEFIKYIEIILTLKNKLKENKQIFDNKIKQYNSFKKKTLEIEYRRNYKRNNIENFVGCIESKDLKYSIIIKQLRFQKINTLTFPCYLHITKFYPEIPINIKFISIYNGDAILFEEDFTEDNQLQVLKPVKIIRKSNSIDVTEDLFKNYKSLKKYLNYYFLFYINKIYNGSISYYVNSSGEKKIRLWDGTRTSNPSIESIATNLIKNGSTLVQIDPQKKCKNILKSKRTKKWSPRKKKISSSGKSKKFKYNFNFIDI